MFSIHIQRAFQTLDVHSTVTVFRQEHITAQILHHESSTISKSALRYRKAQTGTSRGPPSDSDTAREPEDDVSTKIHT